jgi:hypothetical protein
MPVPWVFKGTEVLRLQFFQQQDGNQVLNALDYAVNVVDIGKTADVVGIAQVALANWELGPQVWQSSVLGLYLVRALVYDITVAPVTPHTKNTLHVGASWDNAEGLPNFGTVTGDYLPSFNTRVVQKITGGGGRGNRGYSHTAGLPKVHTVGETLEGTSGANFLAAFINFQTTLVTTDTIPVHFTQVIFQERQCLRAAAGAHPGAYVKTINQWIMQLNIGTITRRKFRSRIGV